MSFALRFLSPLAALAATLVLAGCGDSSEESDPTPSSGGSSATSNEQDAARVKLLQCAREQGVDVPDAEGTGDAFAQLSPAEREQLEAAMQGPCQEYAAQAFGTSEGHDDQFLDDLTRFTACLRENGADVPDPDPSNPFSVLHSLDQSDPTIAAAIAACEDQRPALGGG
jgi:hypothetical protein